VLVIIKWTLLPYLARSTRLIRATHCVSESSSPSMPIIAAIISGDATIARMSPVVQLAYASYYS